MKNTNKKKHIYDYKWLESCDEFDEAPSWGHIGNLNNQSVSVKNKSIRSAVNVSISEDKPI
jgi:hypothetical protein